MPLTRDRAVALLRDNAAWLLAWSVVPLLATKTLFNAPVIVMALIGLARLARDPRRYLQSPAFRAVLALFLCLWVPMLLSLPDAANPRRAVGTALIWLRFPLAAVFVIDVLARRRARARLLAATAATVLVWGADAILQFFAGRNILGYPYYGHQATGMFHPKLVLGTVVGVLLVPTLEWLRQASGRLRAVWLLAALPLAAIALAGNRMGWAMAALGLLGYAVHQALRAPGRRWAAMGLAALLAAGIFGAAMQHEPLRHRAGSLAGLLSMDPDRWDEASGLRLSIWLTATRVLRAHWVNGVGPRGFRYEYRKHLHERDRLAGPGGAYDRATHPHLFALEVAVETGVLGLIGLAAFVFVLVRHLARAFRGPDAARAAWMLAAAIAAFPLNAHMALYASYWSTVLWWLLIVALAWGRAEGAAARR